MSRHIDQEFIVNSFIKPDTDNLVEIVWGGDQIEQLKGIAPSGKPIGESWECSTHAKHPSRVTLQDGSTISLHNLIAQMPEEILGLEIAQEFGGKLPVLVKLLDARQDLSVQVHPSNETASRLGEKDTGKTESWLILDADPGAVLYLGFKEDVNKTEFEKDLTDPKVNIAEKYLNAISVEPGDLFFIPAGSAHAIGKGVFLIEIQQSSGITYRVWDWNRQPRRELHVPQAMQSFNFNKTTRADYEKVPITLRDKEERLVDSGYFSFDRITLSTGEQLHTNTAGSFQILTCIEGQVRLLSQDSKEVLAQGESILVPAALGDYEIVADNKSTIIKSFILTSRLIDPVIFQTYDVRAVADKYLSDRVCFYLGKGYGTFLRRLNKAPEGRLWVTVGGGVRLSTERVRSQVISGIRSSGVNVYDVRITTTPELYFSIPYLKADGGVNITASHNESEYNGIKQVIKTSDGFITSINAEQMLEIKATILGGDFLEGTAQCITIEDGEVVRYHNELVKANCRLGREIWIELLKIWADRGLKSLLDTVITIEFPESRDAAKWTEITKAIDLPDDTAQPDTAVKYPFAGLKVVIDIGNGSAWRTTSVYSDLGAELVVINPEPDGAFPAHIPDPIKAKYRKQLEEAVLKEASVESEKEVVGIGNDEDADRAIYVRADGRAVEGDRSLAIQAKSIIDEHRKLRLSGRPRFMGEVKFSRISEEYVVANGGEYIMCPTGFAFIKDGTKKLSQAINAGLDEVELFGQIIDLRDNKEPVALAAELSGHQMSGHEENWIFDDSLLAAIKILTVIAKGRKEGNSFIDIDESVPRYPATPELNIRLSTNVLTEKEEVVEVVVHRFKEKGYPINTTDGGLIQWIDENGNWLGQALVRKSNTQPNIICRVEGRDEESKRRIEKEFFGELATVSTAAVPKLNLESDDYIAAFLK